jgi:hypothetical protein
MLNVNASDIIGGTSTLSKTIALPKLGSKRTIKPYFPPITANKVPLRLN